MNKIKLMFFLNIFNDGDNLIYLQISVTQIYAIIPLEFFNNIYNIISD